MNFAGTFVCELHPSCHPSRFTARYVIEEAEPEEAYAVLVRQAEYLPLGLGRYVGDGPLFYVIPAYEYGRLELL